MRDSISPMFKPNTSSDENFYALDDVSFDEFPGDSVGIIGKNGAGKSTLLKILSKITPPSSGKIISRGRIASLLEVGTGFHAELSGRENIFLNGSILGMRRAEIQRNFDAIVDFSGVEKFLDTPLKHYSSGMQLRLAFAVAAFLENEIMIIDEVLAVGDAEFQKKCMGKMEDVSKNQGRTILFVSHNMGALSTLCHKSVLLEKGKVKEIGNTNNIINDYLSNNLHHSNSVTYTDEIVKEISIKQERDTIVLTARYEHDTPIKQPNLGFVIYNLTGNPITGTNPLKSGISEFGTPKEKGTVSIRIFSPFLADGIYSVSIWLNDGIGDMLFHKPHCLNLEILQMSTYMEKDLNNEGYVVPLCNWEFC